MHSRSLGKCAARTAGETAFGFCGQAAFAETRVTQFQGMSSSTLVAG